MIPEKLPKGTTREEWEEYEKELRAWAGNWSAIEPDKSDKKAWDKWDFEKEMFRPNKPGSRFSNND